jgi:hypothetical protein
VVAVKIIEVEVGDMVKLDLEVEEISREEVIREAVVKNIENICS